MKLQKMMLLVLLVLLTVAPVAVANAGDFDWTGALDIRAESDLSGFRARLAARFNVGEAQVSAVLGSVERPADAYLVFRLGEMSARSTDFVLESYRNEKSKGWGALARSLGIKPGSREFHALKRGHDLYDDHGQGNDSRKSKGKGNGKGKK